MAKEIARRISIETRSVVIDVQDVFGTVTSHTVPLFGDCCPTCNIAVAGGSTDINVSAVSIVQHITEVETALLKKLMAAGISVPVTA